MEQEFFEGQTEQSYIKSKIVIDYFRAWSRVIKSHWAGPIGYIDLYSGPGRYADGTESVPLLLISEVLKDKDLSNRMLLAFNDADEKNIEILKAEVSNIPEARNLLKRSTFSSDIVDGEFWERIRVNHSIPVLSFVDPFGYKGLTIQLINRLIENNGSDCIFFFNFNRINMALSTNPNFDEHMAALFGLERMRELKATLAPLSATYREQVVLNSLLGVLKENKANYVLPFKFYCKEMKRTSHFIIFVTKHPAGYKIMKNIMYANSDRDVDGVASFEFKDHYNFGDKSEQLTIFSRPLDDLCEQLLEKYAGQRMLIGNLCSIVHNDTNSSFVAQNVKEALKHLERDKKVIIEGRKKKYVAGKITMPDTAYAIFKEQSNVANFEN